MPGGELVFVGHSTVLLDLGGTRILTDPLLERRVAHIRRRTPVPDVTRLLPLSAILISHSHADHLHRASLRRVAGEHPVIAPHGCGRMLKRWGVQNVVEVETGERIAVGDVEVEAVPALHDGRRQPLGRRMDAVGYLVDGPVRVYFAGDTDVFDDMAALAGRVDIALLPVWGWGPRLPEGHLDPESAARAVELIRPRIAVPIHWGTLQSVGAPRSAVSIAPARAFAAAVADRGLDTEVRILRPGEAMRLEPLPAA
jgi:L-ascorbate metabolism protein UlaG (beta-lactamase superfamily)